MAADPQDPPRHAGQVVRRVLLRRNIAVDTETAQLVADAVQAVLQAEYAFPAAAPRPACSSCRLRAAVLSLPSPDISRTAFRCRSTPATHATAVNRAWPVIQSRFANYPSVLPGQGRGA